MTMESCTPHGCQCSCHNPGGMQVSHVVDCCFAAGMTVEVKTEWHCEQCGAVFTTEAEAWNHWMGCPQATTPSLRGTGEQPHD